MNHKKKDYIVIVETSKSRESIQVKARNKKESKRMVSDVLLKCDIFKFNSPKDFQLKCFRMLRRN